MTCTASGVAQLGQYANLGTVDTDQEVTDSDPSHYVGYYLEVSPTTITTTTSTTSTTVASTTIETLPFTGAGIDEGGMAGVALALLSAGGIALLAIRRREEGVLVAAEERSDLHWDTE